MSKTHSNQSIYYLPTREKEQRSKKKKKKKKKNPEAFSDCLQTINDMYENLEDYNQIKEKEVLIMLNHLIAGM